METAPRSAYLHVPFCARRCGYCNFAVVAGRDDLVNHYLRAVEVELAGLGGPHPVDTLYFGGGTPTRLPEESLIWLCRLASSTFPPDPGHEWTVEANPGDVTPRLCRELVRLGVTRLSLGAQSLDPAKLHALERDHTPNDVHNAVAAAQDAGLRVAADLIFAAPGEALDAWRLDLDALLALSPDHVSTYGLTIEKGTTFFNRRVRGALDEAGDELQREMYLVAIDTLTAAGLEHYEVSNFARPGQRSRHNEAYWRGASYFGVGPCAARYVGGRREANHRSTTTYLKRVLSGGSPTAESESLDDAARARERLVFGLRRLEGVDRGDFAAATGRTIDDLAGPTVARFVAMGLLVDDGRRIRLTRDGLLVSDALWPDLI